VVAAGLRASATHNEHIVDLRRLDVMGKGDKIGSGKSLDEEKEVRANR
jgi:hypothetical protein